MRTSASGKRQADVSGELQAGHGVLGALTVHGRRDGHRASCAGIHVAEVEGQRLQAVRTLDRQRRNPHVNKRSADVLDGRQAGFVLQDDVMRGAARCGSRTVSIIPQHSRQRGGLTPEQAGVRLEVEVRIVRVRDRLVNEEACRAVPGPIAVASRTGGRV